MDLVSQFLDEVSSSMRKFYGTRDNCGPATLDFISWAKSSHNMQLTRIFGHFKADLVVFDKDDFTPDMKKEFYSKYSRHEFESAQLRKAFIENSPQYREEWKLVPHYWAVDANGSIFDVVGNMQFVVTGLASDLNASRYIPC